VGDEGVEMIINAGWKKIKGLILSKKDIDEGDNKISHKGAKLLRKADWPELTKIELSNDV
jgi:hypothetical protein